MEKLGSLILNITNLIQKRINYIEYIQNFLDELINYFRISQLKSSIEDITDRLKKGYIPKDSIRDIIQDGSSKNYLISNGNNIFYLFESSKPIVQKLLNEYSIYKDDIKEITEIFLEQEDRFIYFNNLIEDLFEELMSRIGREKSKITTNVEKIVYTETDNVGTHNIQTEIMEKNFELENLQNYINSQIDVLNKIILINDNPYLVDNYIIGLFANLTTLLEIIKKENRSMYEAIKEDSNFLTNNITNISLIGLSSRQKIEKLNNFINLLSRLELKVVQTSLIKKPIFRENIIIILITLTHTSTIVIDKILSF